VQCLLDRPILTILAAWKTCYWHSRDILPMTATRQMHAISECSNISTVSKRHVFWPSTTKS